VDEIESHFSSFLSINIKALHFKVSFEVIQFQFLDWPVGGVPATTSALLRIHKAAVNVYKGKSNPVVVQCR